MPTPDNLAQQWSKADDPIAAVMADVRVVKVMQDDLDKYVERSDLSPMDAQKIDAVSWNLRERLRQADTFVDQYATSVGAPAPRNYLLGSEPKPYPTAEPLANKMFWYARESVRLVENIDRRLNLDRAAQAGQELTARAAKGKEPARLRNAASQIMDNQPYLGHLLSQQGGLPATRMMLNDVTAKLLAQQQSTGKLQKKNPRAAAAEARSTDRSTGLGRRERVKKAPMSPRAAAASLPTSRAASPAESDAGVTSDWTRNKLQEALMTLGTLATALAKNPFAEAARGTSPGKERGRQRDRAPLGPGPVRAPSVSPASSPSRLSGRR